jgi:hypothetical protein
MLQHCGHQSKPSWVFPPSRRHCFTLFRAVYRTCRGGCRLSVPGYATLLIFEWELRSSLPSHFEAELEQECGCDGRHSGRTMPAKGLIPKSRVMVDSDAWPSEMCSIFRMVKKSASLLRDTSERSVDSGLLSAWRGRASISGDVSRII